MLDKKKLKEENNQSIATKIILDSIADGVFTVDQEFNITSFNRAAEKITGIESQEAIGRKCFNIFHANICQTACVLKETITTGKEFIDVHVNILNHDGNIISVSISTSPLRNDRGKIIGGVETFRFLAVCEEMIKEIEHDPETDVMIITNHEIQSI